MKVADAEAAMLLGAGGVGLYGVRGLQVESMRIYHIPQQTFAVMGNFAYKNNSNNNVPYM